MTEKLTYKQVTDQESRAYVKGEPMTPTVLVERSDGTIQTGKLDMSTRNVSFVDPKDGKEKYHLAVPLEKLSDAYQEKLAAALAGAALKGEEPSGSSRMVFDEVRKDGVLVQIPVWENDK